MLLTGEVTIKSDADSLYVKVIPFGMLEVLAAAIFLGLFAFAVITITINNGSKIDFIMTPIAVTLAIVVGVSLLSKKEFWFTKDGVRIRETNGIFKEEYTSMPLESPCVEWKTAGRCRGGYMMVMTYPHSGEKVTFFENMGLSKKKAQMTCDAVEACISGKPINVLIHE